MGVVDDTCDGIITANLVVNGRRFSAQARICVGPPITPRTADRSSPWPRPGRPRPRPAGADELLAAEADTQRRLADLFQRVWETASLVNVDAIRARALDDHRRRFPPPSTDSLPHTDATSMRPSDTPYADAKVEALIPETPTDWVQLVFSTLVALAHDQLTEEDELVDFPFNQSERLRLMIRPAYGAFHQLSQRSPRARHSTPRSATRAFSATGCTTCECRPTCATRRPPYSG